MKRFRSGEILKYHSFVKILGFSLLAFFFFYLGKHWSHESQQLVFFNRQNPVNTPYVAISPYTNKTFDNSAVISRNSTDSIDGRNSSLNSTLPLSTNFKSLPSPPPHVSPLESRFGIIDENGTMQEQFEVGLADPDLLDNLENNTETQGKGEKDDKSRVTVVGKFSICSESMTDYIPCLDNLEKIKKLKSTAKGENFERHCPVGDRALKCLIPRPKGYKKPMKWPKSRDEVWFNNVPHTRLVQDKGGQNWISRKGDKFTFPGGGTQFIHGADQYLDQISKMVPDISFGQHTRVALDVGCGVASFGAFLLSRNVTTLSIGPKDVHENQIQFALERGVPSMLSVFATRRLLYPSQAFDFIHCSRCRINWTRDDGILLLEANRMLRAGGYFLWAAQPVYKHDEEQQEVWKDMEDLTSRICWVLVKKEGYLAIWKKPSNNSCYLNREDELHPPLCDTNDDPDNVWYVDLKPCITRLPDNGYGSNITSWPKRLDLPPDRLQLVNMDSYIARTELFMAENRYLKEVIDGYAGAFHWRDYGLRNVMDMKAGFGGFAAALLHLPIDCWVMNVVPISGPNTLPVIYDRGLIGVSHDWCEPFDTYPRTYDFLHAAGLFSIERKRCNITNILLEMDRILRPGGRAYIRDTINVIEEVHQIVKAMGWRTQLRDTGEGPHASWRFIIGDKQDP